MMKRLTIALIMLLLVTAVLTACGGMEPETAEEPAAEEAGGSENPVSATGSERTGDEPPAPPEDGRKVEVTRLTTDAVVEIEESFAGEADAALAAAPMATPAPATELGDRAETTTADTGLTLDQNSRLTAGEVDDNAQWDDYLLFLRDYSGAYVERVDVSERHQIWVQGSQGQPVVGQEVAITANGEPIATLRTHSDGRVYFFPRAYPIQADEYQVEVASEFFTIPANGSQREWFVTVEDDGSGETAVNLDILFLIDATGSISDEINQLKENIRAISAQIDALPSQPDVRFSMVTYRDRSDAYLT
ncbi:MAG: VWA domain-containing protein, partial [Anaerolineales bacterium]|nr:VWA domain-containing protein [Anaerolineales bacterium]